MLFVNKVGGSYKRFNYNTRGGTCVGFTKWRGFYKEDKIFGHAVGAVCTYYYDKD